MERLRRIGARKGVIQIVPPRTDVRPAYIREDEDLDHELLTRPLASPTGPGGAAGFSNRHQSQIAVPEVHNIYMGTFWGDQAFVEQFSKDIVERGYLQPLKDLNYGTGPGKYMGSIEGRALHHNSQFHDRDAQSELAKMIDAGTLQPNENSLYVLILPDKVVSIMDQDGSRSCRQFCGYHDAFQHNGLEVAYAVLPSSKCKGCGGQIADFTAVYAHELAEAATDKVPGEGWVADDGSENGDLEAWILFGWGPPDDPNRYTVQGYYTNQRGNTAGPY
jgi:hypothetical protein